MNDEPRPLEPGMLLLGNVRDVTAPPDSVLTVKSVGAKSAQLIAHFDTYHWEGQLKRTTLPDGWQVLHNRQLASFLEGGELW